MSELPVAIDPTLPLEHDYEVQIAHLDEPTRILFRKHFHQWWQKQSPFIENNWVMTFQTLALHVREAEKAAKGEASKAQRAAAAAQRAQEREERAHLRMEREGVRIQDAAFTVRFMAWQEECRKRNEYIANLKREWRKAVADAKSSAVQWDTYVAAKREELKVAQDWPAPPMPVRGA